MVTSLANDGESSVNYARQRRGALESERKNSYYELKIDYIE